MRNWRHILAIAALAALPAAVLAGDSIGQPAAQGDAATAPAAGAPAGVMRVLASPVPRAQFWFGVAVENIPPSIAKQLKLKANQGLMVSAVLPDSPAAKIGLQPDDILTDINSTPLTTQNDLFIAANPATKDGSAPSPRPSTLTYLRNGDRLTAEIVPEPRPEKMIVYDGGGGKSGENKVRNYVTPSGGGAQVSTGYRMNLAASPPGDFTAKSIKSLVSQGQTIVLSQETDAAGNVKHTITVGAAVYAVEAEHLDALPEDIRPLGQQLLAKSPEATTATKPAPTAPSTTAALTLEQRLKAVEDQNAELRRQIEELKRAGAAPGK